MYTYMRTHTHRAHAHDLSMVKVKSLKALTAIMTKEIRCIFLFGEDTEPMMAM